MDQQPHRFSPYFVSVYALTAIIALLSFAMLPFLPEQIPLWYSLAIPEQQLVPKLVLLIIPAIAILISFFHSLFLQKYLSAEHTLRTVFAWATLLSLLILAIALGRLGVIFVL